MKRTNGKPFARIALACLVAMSLCAAPAASFANKRLEKKANAFVRATRDSKAPRAYAERADVLEFVDELAGRHGFRRDELITLFGSVHYSETAARLMAPSATATRRDWSVYRARFVEPVRIAAGVRFWDAYAPLLERAEREFGVPAEIIVGILGVETVFGRNTGSFRVVDALTTLAFDYPNKARDRSPFFRDQLGDLLVLARDTGIDVFGLRGSYAGAVGMPQFMPGSIRRYAVDYDGDGVIDLAGSPADVIGSVANFLARHGWVRDTVAAYPLHAVGASLAGTGSAEKIETLVAAGSEPGVAREVLLDAGLASNVVLPDTPLALIDLPNGIDAEGRTLTDYVAGTQNFHVITRYNRSYFYAYSVIELGGTIKALREAR